MPNPSRVRIVIKPVLPLGETINLSHGSGGRDMHRLLKQLIYPILCAEPANESDSACIPLNALASHGDRLAFTTDSYTVSPLFFPGGDIGSLAVNGTVNDLAMAGAVPQYLSCALILEEGFSIASLTEILTSMRRAADSAGIKIITGDTKVVHRGAADKIFINTTGIGVIPLNRILAPEQICAGDVVIVSGYIGDHGTAILSARDELQLEIEIESDCQALNELVEALVTACPNTRLLRDATRGGVATVVNEIAGAAGVGIQIYEEKLPVRPMVRGACEILGLDPLYLANEGTLVAVVASDEAAAAVTAMRSLVAGEHAVIIGECSSAHPGVVSLITQFGGERVIDVPAGELLPRIC